MSELARQTVASTDARLRHSSAASGAVICITFAPSVWPIAKKSEWLDGGKTYKLTVPKDAPVALLWSFTVYDSESRCFVDIGSPPDRSWRDDITKNTDGSVEVHPS